MTEREQRIIRKALRELMEDDGDFNGAIEALGQLVGVDYPPGKMLRRVRQTDFRKLAAGPNRSFSAGRKKV